MKFEKGDIVKLCGFTRREATNDRSCKYGIRYFLQCYTKEHNLAELTINDYDVEYVILPTKVMQIFSRLEDGELIRYYPIQELNDSHSKKVFISEVYLKKVGSLNDYNATDEVDSSEDDEDEWSSDKWDDEWDDEELNEDTPEDEPVNKPTCTCKNDSKEDMKADLAEAHRYQEFLRISKNIDFIISSLQEVVESLTKIVKSEI